MKLKTFSILGDSISTFKDWIPCENEVFYPKDSYDVTHVAHTWWHLLMEQTGLELICNESYSGSRISETGVRPIASAFISEKRQARLSGDLIIIFGGTNDFGQAEQPTTLEIFTQAYIRLVDGMVKRHSKSELYFCTPLQRTDRSLDEQNLHGWTQNDLANTIRTIVLSNPRVHLIDLASYPIQIGDGLLLDNLHPSRKGMELVCSMIKQNLDLQLTKN